MRVVGIRVAGLASWLVAPPGFVSMGRALNAVANRGLAFSDVGVPRLVGSGSLRYISDRADRRFRARWRRRWGRPRRGRPW